MENNISNRAIFNTHGSDSTWCERDGEACKVLRPLTDEEADLFDVGMMYRVRFNDGVETDAFEDELELMEMEG